MSLPSSPPSYPAIRFISTWGDALAIIVALACAAIGVYAVCAGFHWLAGAVGVAAGALLWLVLRSYVEVLRILADTLMPR